MVAVVAGVIASWTQAILKTGAAQVVRLHV